MSTTKTTAKTRILEFLTKRKGFPTTSTWTAKFLDIPHNTVRGRLSELYRDGKIERTRTSIGTVYSV